MRRIAACLACAVIAAIAAALVAHAARAQTAAMADAGVTTVLLDGGIANVPPAADGGSFYTAPNAGPQAASGGAAVPTCAPWPSCLKWMQVPTCAPWPSCGPGSSGIAAPRDAGPKASGVLGGDS